VALGRQLNAPPAPPKVGQAIVCVACLLRDRNA
jgi:hypothetical protein